MRVSTVGAQMGLVNQMLRQQAAIQKTQLEVSTGVRVQSPSDDPVAAGRILQLESELSRFAQYERNTNSVQTRLEFEEQSLADAGTVLQRVRELTLQANSGTLDRAARVSIATELEQRIGELEAIANRRDGSGEYLFAGYQVNTQPFVRSAGAMTYAGDQGVREMQIGATQFMKSGDTGFDVFMNVQEGNGTFTVASTATNTGSAWIAPGTVVDAGAWTPGTYTVRFTDATNYEILDSTNTSVGAGAYTSGEAITFSGVRFEISGDAAAGDTFTLAAAGRQDMFTTLDRLAATLRASTQTGGTSAQFNTEIAKALAQIDQDMDQVLNVRAQVGARLNTIDTVAATREDLELELTGYVSKLRDVDWAEAVSRLSTQYTGLQAAQKSYSQFAQLSLFDYL